MGVVVTIAVVAGLCLALGLLCKLIVQLMSTVAWGSILLAGFWVVANILLILKLEARPPSGRPSPSTPYCPRRA